MPARRHAAVARAFGHYTRAVVCPQGAPAPPSVCRCIHTAPTITARASDPLSRAAAPQAPPAGPAGTGGAPAGSPRPAAEGGAARDAGGAPHDVDESEVMQLVLHWLAAGPCRQAARALEAEAEALGLLPMRHDPRGGFGPL